MKSDRNPYKYKVQYQGVTSFSSKAGVEIAHGNPSHDKDIVYHTHKIFIEATITNVDDDIIPIEDFKKFFVRLVYMKEYEALEFYDICDYIMERIVAEYKLCEDKSAPYKAKRIFIEIFDEDGSRYTRMYFPDNYLIENKD